MGIVFGITGCEEPKFLSLVASSASKGVYQVRQYEPYFIAEAVGCSGGVGGEDQSFRVLAKYIGVFGTPENVSKAPMAMTAHVVFTAIDPTPTAISPASNPAPSTILMCAFRKICCTGLRSTPDTPSSPTPCTSAGGRPEPETLGPFSSITPSQAAAVC
jgi:hypothetical protein